MLKLFVVLLGGRAEGCNTELHDTVFVVAESIETAYPKLVSKWFGITKRLHIDSFFELKIADGYEITVSDTPSADSENKLFFVNFGGYEPGVFEEKHQIKFYVAKQKKDAVAKAKNELCVGLSEQHCDDNLNLDDKIDDVIQIEGVDRYHLHLTPTDKQDIPVITSKYKRLDVPDILAQVKSQETA